jgi:hypothetical protein
LSRRTWARKARYSSRDGALNGESGERLDVNYERRAVAAGIGRKHDRVIEQLATSTNLTSKMLSET